MNKIVTLFLILFNASLVVAQTLPNDCVRAITVCGNGTFFSNASGIGTVQEINGASCGGSESNSLWLKITIAASVIPGSTLGFNLIPDDPSTNVDYDFYVFPANAVCGALGNAIRCCTTNPGPAPFGAALSNNITGINGSTLQTAVGPGPAASSSGDDYVRWLTVIPNQTYYIAIDRPVGNGGFQIQWTGTATAGAGAFTTPPTANSIADLKTCSNTPNVGIFDLNSVRPLINSNLILNTITFHTTISNAIDNIAPLPNIYVNTSNPQTIYVRVTDNASKCFSTTSFNLVVNLVPNATLSVSNTVICNGDSVTVTYSGTPGATFDYTIDGGLIQTGLFPASGIFIITETLTSNRTYTLNGVRNLDSSGVIICNQPLNISRTVTVNQQPDAGQNGGLTICASSLTPLDLFSIITGGQIGGTWTRTSGTGGVFDSVLGTFTPTAGATTSTFEYTLLGVAPCINDISVATITIGGQPDAGSNGITTICETNTTAIDLFNLITGAQAGGTWTRTTGTGGIFNAATGNYIPAVGATSSIFTYTILGVAPCITDVSTASVSVFAQPTAPTASVTVQPTCTTPTGTIVVTVPTPATNITYTLTGTNPVVAAVTQSSATFSNLAPGVYNVTTTNTTTGCISTATVVTINAVPTIATPTASATVQPTCATPTGTIVVTVPTGANLEYSVNGTTYQASAAFTGLTPNNYNVTVRNTTNGCVSTATIITINAVPTIATPTVSATVQPTCATPTGTIVVTAPTGANLEYSVNGTTYQASAAFTGLTPNNYNVTVRNTSNGCVSTLTIVTINAVPTIAAPTASATVQPTCTTPTGTIVVTAPTGVNFEYSVNGTTFQTSTTFSGLVPNTYNVIVKNTTNSCSSVPTIITINPIPTIATPTASAIVQPTCTNPTGTIVVTAPTGANLEYSVNGATYQASATFTGLTPNNYNVTVRNTTNGCVSTATIVTINAIPTIATPTASATVQPTCTNPTGTIVVTAPTGVNLEYSVNGATYQASATFTGLTPNNYNVTVRNTINGCVSTATIVTINAIPTVATPTASTTVQPTCTIPTGTIVVTAPTGANLEYSVNGATYQASATFTGLTPNNYNVTVRNTTNGCISTATPLTVNPIPSVAIPTTTIQQPDCTILTGSIQVDSPLGASLQYSIDGIIFQASPNFTGLVINNYTITVKDILNGCTNTTVPIAIVNSVNDVIVNINPSPLEDCDPNNDGYVAFDLTQIINSITGGNPGYTVTFHETVVDATIGGTNIPNPLIYDNINPWSQTIFIRVDSNTTSCFEVVPLQLIINRTPISPVNLNPITVCDQDTNPQDGITAVDLTQLESAILAQQPQPITSTYTISYYTSQSDAQTPTATPISNVTSYVTASAEIWIRIANNGTTCFNTGSFQVVVNTPLSLTTPLPLSLCDNDANPNNQFQVFNLTVKDFEISGGLGTVTYYPSLLDAQNGTNVITTPTAYQNAPAYPAVQTLGVVVTTSAGCKSITTLDIRVEPLPTLTPPANVIEVCDSNQDGFGDFNLSSLVPGLLNGITTYVVSFHETLTDAQLDVNAINTSISYTTITPLMQMLYVRAEDTITGCWSTLTITLNVNPSPIAPINLNPITVCDQDATPQDGITAVDLSQQQAAILAQQPQPASTYTISYYTSLLDAQNQTAPIINITSYVTTSREIWVRVEDNTTLSCSNISSFQVVINKPLSLPNSLPPYSLCDYDSNPIPNPNDQYHIFDLTQAITTLPLVTGATVAYYPSLLDAQNGTNVILTPGAYQNALAYPGVQTLGVVVTTAAGCRSITTLDIRVLPIPTPRTNPPALSPKCDDNLPGDMLEVFDLTVNESYIENSDPNLSFHYFQTQADAIANINEILNPNAALVGTNVWIRVENNRVDYFNNKCYVLVEQPLTVNPLPTVAIIADYQICEADPSGVNDGFEVFDLTSQINALITNNPTPPNYTVRFFEDVTLTIPINNPITYTNLNNPQIIYVQITNDATTCRSLVGQFNILVNPKPSINIVMADMLECDYDGINDGLMLYTQNPTSTQASLAGYVNDILGAVQIGPTFIVEFYNNSQADAEAGNSANALTNLESYQLQTGTYWIRVENTITGCYQLDSFDVVIEKLADPVITSNTGSNIACVNWNETAVNNNLILASGISAPNYTFNWYADGNLIPGANSATYAVTNIVTDSVTYTVEAVSFNPPLLGCVSDITAASTFEVVRSGSAANVTYTVTNAFAENQIITVINDGYGVYEYSLDDGPRQTSNVFENVSLGSHSIYVWDARNPDGYSCGVVSIMNVQVIDYPHYFTPNGDGIHDNWNIVGLEGQPAAKIYIFDRYGKLIKQISSTGAGWDGTYNGSQLPSDDYWFTVEYEEGTIKQFKAHFALKR